MRSSRRSTTLGTHASHHHHNIIVNHKIVRALLVVLLLFLVVSICVWWRVPVLKQSSAFFERRHGAPAPKSSVLDHEGDGDPKVSPRQRAIAHIRYKFPIHAADDLEEIEHAGVSYATTEGSKRLPKTISVPKFWDSSAYGPGGVREYLGNYGERLITANEAADVGSFAKGGWDGDLETIFVSIASYRDFECGATIESVYARAKHPHRIRVAVVSQRVSGDPLYCDPPKPCAEDPNQAYCNHRNLVDIFDMDANLSVGPVFARHIGNRMYRGEYFAMQIDSHVRFIRDWDVDLVNQWWSAKNEMAVLTTYLSDITNSIDPVTHENKHPNRPIMCKSDFEGTGDNKHLRHGQQPEGAPGIHGQPTLHPFWAAGFSMARGHFVAQIPYDQYLPMVFQGEEISIGLRAWTFGYDFYTPETSVCFHRYAIKENKEMRKKVPLFWEHASIYAGVETQAMRRLNGIIKMAKDPSVPYDRREEEKYGLGKVRTTKKFFDTFGIHPETQTVEDNLCTFVGKPMMRLFLPHRRTNRMGLNYDEISFEYVDKLTKRKSKIAQLKSQKPPAKAKLQG